MTKYYNKKVVADGSTFDSKVEYKRYCELLLLQKAGEIAGLLRQVKFELIPSQTRDDGKKERACHYIADFMYFVGDKTVVEDVKSDYTRKLSDYIMKRKLMLFVNKISIREIT